MFLPTRTHLPLRASCSFVVGGAQRSLEPNDARKGSIQHWVTSISETRKDEQDGTGKLCEVLTACIMRHKRIPDVKRETGIVDLCLRSCDIPPIYACGDITNWGCRGGRRNTDTSVRRDVHCCKFVRNDVPRLPSESLNLSRASSGLVEYENESEQKGKDEDRSGWNEY